MQAVTINQKLVLNRGLLGSGRSRQDESLEASQFQVEAERVYRSETSMLQVAEDDVAIARPVPRTQEVSHRRPRHDPAYLMEKSYRPEIREAITAFVTGRQRSVDMVEQLSANRTSATFSRKNRRESAAAGSAAGGGKTTTLSLGKAHRMFGRRRMTAVEEQ